jgi:parallel beta-helix repeat protein
LDATASEVTVINAPELAENTRFDGDTALDSATRYRQCTFQGGVMQLDGDSDVRFEDCRFIDCRLDVYQSDNVVVKDSSFSRAGVRIRGGSTYVNVWGNRFQGAGQSIQPVILLECSGCTVVNNIFNATDRGVVVQVSAGRTVEKCLFLGNVYRAINSRHGGDEYFLIEQPGTFRQSLILGERMYNCHRSAVLVWGTEVNDLVFYDLQCEGASSIWFHDTDDDTTQTGCYFLRCTFRGGGYFKFEPTASGNTIYQCHWTNLQNPVTFNNSGDPAKVDSWEIWDAPLLANRLQLAAQPAKHGLERIMVKKN